MNEAPREEKVTLRALDGTGGNLELEMPGWVLGAIGDGCAVAFGGGGGGDGHRSVDAAGTITRRLPLQPEDWASVARRAEGEPVSPT